MSNDVKEVKEIVDLMMERNEKLSLVTKDDQSLIWGLIKRVLNALIGDKARNYRKILY